MMSQELTPKLLLRWGIQSIFHSTENIFISQEKLGCIFYVYTRCSLRLILFSIIQEFSEYVSLAPSFTTDSFLHNVSQPHSLIHAGQVSPRSGIISRELSPVERSASNRITQDPPRTELESVDKDQYYQKVNEQRVGG